MIEQAEDQITALAEGARSEWHVRDPYAADAVRRLLRGAGIDGDDGTVRPEHGHHVILNRSGTHEFGSLNLQVGASAPGLRKPSNSVIATVVGPTIDDAMTMLRGRPDEGMLPSITRRAFTLD
ncbi:hypothetical protein [Curtobacterium flaccumfaciens]|uniref:hypothetical protein n=1 Tax=Curtobacterium flaccumfaciens TaxID=2035 RepID=UPI001BDF565E|nr:hypothetical protein [Curtobacterium flaccumfaciens]MBT1681816.1 hypothetical protein [Curtobacterium flaccumfaciens pv. flaccumfaciens]